MGNFNDGPSLPNGSGVPSHSGSSMNIAAASLVFIVILYGILLLFAIACYIIQALGIYNIAKRRGFDRPWYAWIPVASSWLIGRLSDQYQWVAKGNKKNKGKLLLWLDVSMLIVATITIILAITLTIISAKPSNNMSDSTAGLILAFVFVMMLIYFVMLALSIVRLVFYYIALYDIFASCDPEKKVLFIVLSIIFGIQAFFIFAIRNKDLGMHPEQPQYTQTYM